MRVAIRKLRATVMVSSRRLRAFAACVTIIAAGGVTAEWTTPTGFGWVALSGFLLTATLLVLLLARLGFGLPTMAIVVGGLGLYLVYLSYTPFVVRSYDASSHLSYIRYVVENQARPPPSSCSICSHPPLYYGLAAAVYACFQATGLATPTLGLQLLSLVLFLCFVIFALLTIKLLSMRRLQRYLASAMVVFWPYSVINSVRVSNDALLYALTAAGLYFLARWYKKQRPQDLHLACGAALLGWATKANALLLIAIIFAVVAQRLFASRDRRKLFTALGPLALLAGVVALSAAFQSGDGLARMALGGAHAANAPELTERRLRYYASFDVPSFIARPYAQAPRLRTVEPTYWNHLLKSSLFGTRDSSRVRLPNGFSPREVIAKPLSYMLLGLLALLAIGAMRARKMALARNAFSLIATLIFVAGGLAFHLLVPTAHHNDFRFIYPVVIPLSTLFGSALSGLRRSWLHDAVYGLAGVFLATSIAYFIPYTPTSLNPKTKTTVAPSR